MDADRDLPRVLVVGAGFGGLSAAAALADAPVRVTLVDRRNYHLFQPLLYQVATAALSPGDIAWPVRRVLRGQDNLEVRMGGARGVDLERRRVDVDGVALDYDYLVLAPGVTHAYFGHDQWAEHAPGLKSIEDATRIRRHILMAFEQAELSADERERERYMTFVIVGGGPTGVEMAGAISELARKALRRDFRHIDPSKARVVLVEAAHEVLPAFRDDLASFAHRALRRLGVEVLVGDPITACDERGVALGERRIDAATVIWAAGVAAPALITELPVPHDQAGRVAVSADLSVPGHPEVFVVGDAASVLADDGSPVPGVAPAAKQQGRHAARVIRARLAGDDAELAFRYRDPGSLATIGRRAAVIDFGRFALKGWLAWWVWGFAHIYFLIGMRNRLAVALNWLWNYVWFESGARLITGETAADRVEAVHRGRADE